MINLAKKRLLLGITGGVAAYKAAELVRLLVRQNVEVQVVMTQAACQFITPVTMQALSGRPVFTDLWDNRIDNGMAHIDLTRDSMSSWWHRPAPISSPSWRTVWRTTCCPPFASRACARCWSRRR